MTSLLQCTDLSAGYTGSPVLRGLNLSVGKGEVLALLGPNGAGKTTALLALSGLHPRMGGQVQVAGADVASAKPRAAARAGVVLVPDDRSLFKTLTVVENLRLAARSKTKVDGVFDLFPRLADRTHVLSGLLSGGEQQMLAVGRALVQDPKVLLIDELSMGLAPVIVQALLPVIRRVADETGTAVILVEQHVSLALQMADSAVVLAHGHDVLRGTAAELWAQPDRVESAYLGETAA
ncbi:ABC transporter ATP-binding protein [Nocardioides pacificus]